MSKPDEPSARILAIDDDRALLDTYAAIIESQGMRLTPATTLAEGLRLAATRPFDVCLLDRNIGYDLGTDALPELKSQAPSLRIIMATAHRDTDAALEALRLGVDDYLVKPFSPEQLRIALARQIEARRLARKVDVLEREAGQRNPRELASEAPAMQQALALARQVARTSANVLLLGESGTGKNVFARAIHGWSPRAEHGFVPVNCPSLSAELLENELFGHRKGAYTGAQESSEGRVAQAEGGTLFLDEIGDFPLALQPKLLRFIQDKEYERVGDPQSRQANVRLVTATHRDLPTMSEVGEFRLDLYYRLNVVAITLPPLRERREDVLALRRRVRLPGAPLRAGRRARPGRLPLARQRARAAERDRTCGDPVPAGADSGQPAQPADRHGRGRCGERSGAADRCRHHPRSAGASPCRGGAGARLDAG
jgi:NtrC-family two-component system response regulator AlgB